ncbi:hypothetical protein PR202_gb07830 [Eleusine coracana subsp. coracana]|uniref:Uncharacterized protein n=1 Tax=Eleusine coracana subsp. coracana TaxID=191504 RepID=A0AAV5EDB0_ELECO|nr:hypothetical protein PR202_gb07830 [Eleusine coracana subsp. coracana]
MEHDETAMRSTSTATVSSASTRTEKAGSQRERSESPVTPLNLRPCDDISSTGSNGSYDRRTTARGISGILYYTPQILEQAGVGTIFSKFGLNSTSTSIPTSAVTTLLMVPSIGIAMRVMDIFGRNCLLALMAPKRTRKSTRAQSKKQSSPEKGEEEAAYDIPAAIQEFPASAMDAEKINRMNLDVYVSNPPLPPTPQGRSPTWPSTPKRRKARIEDSDEEESLAERTARLQEKAKKIASEKTSTTRQTMKEDNKEKLVEEQVRLSEKSKTGATKEPTGTAENPRPTSPPPKVSDLKFKRSPKVNRDIVIS